MVVRISNPPAWIGMSAGVESGRAMCDEALPIII
jgi:hypothetical protein